MKESNRAFLGAVTVSLMDLFGRSPSGAGRVHEGAGNPVGRLKPALRTIRIRRDSQGNLDPDHLNEIVAATDPHTLRRIRRKTGGNRYRHMLSRSHFG